ncbi:hypothetical protein CTTA_4441 [Comamonas testosteroni]|uniref:Uncharacterized protein n=1 Tax=Comamonas testosteroni TaxID=285 RepID=A0A5A7MI81_COMTE|nr:hypothetical protein [Comamonas testosteroni]GEQ77436.1 hypothetical protein CTTA_4441 [Comamonas testosteroni]
MILTLDLWQAISLLATIVGAFWGIAKMMLNQGSKNLDEKFSQINKRLDGQEESDKRLERQVGDMRAELPREYVRRDDFIRAISNFDVRVDQLRLTIERALLERDKH